MEPTSYTRLQDFSDALQSFEAYLRFQAAGFCGYVAKLEAYTPKIPGQGYFIFPEIPGVHRIDLADRDIASYLEEVKQRIAESVQFDRSKYQLDYAGQFENQERAQRRFTLILGLVLGVMLLLLYAEFGNLRQSLLLLGIVPLAALGGLIALFVTGQTLNIATAVGFIGLFGVAVQNGIIMLANLNRVRETGASLRDAVIIGASERFRPVLMTATVATIGMMPAALATGVGSDVQRGVATVVIGGLVLATLLTLFIVPSFYYSIERIAERWPASRQAVSAATPAE